MSVKLQSIVWEYSALEGTDLLAMIAIADQANDEGEVTLSHDTLAQKLRMKSISGVKACIRRLLASGELSKTERFTVEQRQTSNAYKIEVGNLLGQPQLYFYSWQQRKAAAQGKSKGGVTVFTPGGVTTGTPGGVTTDTPNHLEGNVSKETAASRLKQGAQVEQAAAAAFNLSAKSDKEQSQAPSALSGLDHSPEGGENTQATDTENVPPALTARSALGACFKTQAFLDRLLGEFPDRQGWLKLAPEVIQGLLNAARLHHGPAYTTPLVKALDAEVQKLKTPRAAAPAKKTGLDVAAMLTQLKQEAAGDKK